MFKFLVNIKSLEELKKEYKTLARKLHPDMGGNTEDMQTLNAEFEMLFPLWKNNDHVTDTETATTFTRRFYTANGWEGSRYDGHLSNKDIAKKVREFVKCVYPECKFSVTADVYTITIALMEAPYNVFIDNATAESTKGYIRINRYGITKDDRINEKAQIMLKTVYDYLNSYNYDDSDAMYDYFDTNFYAYVGIGKWDKPFKVVEKTMRIKDKKPTTKQRTTADSTTDTDSENNYTYNIKEDVDTRDNSKIYVVKVIENLTREEYIKVANKMKKLGGYYSKFKHGFLFRTYPSALAE